MTRKNGYEAGLAFNPNDESKEDHLEGKSEEYIDGWEKGNNRRTSLLWEKQSAHIKTNKELMKKIKPSLCLGVVCDPDAQGIHRGMPKICNPATGKCVLGHTAQGRALGGKKFASSRIIEREAHTPTTPHGRLHPLPYPYGSFSKNASSWKEDLSPHNDTKTQATQEGGFNFFK